MKKRFNRHRPLAFSYRLKFAKKTAPKGWGNDTLSRFQEMAFGNEMATFAHFPKWNGLLSKISIVLEECTKYALGEIKKSDADLTAYMLFMAAHSDYLALVRCAAAGHCLPAYPVGRASVEFSLYSWYLSGNPEATALWHNKPDKGQPRKNWNNEFHFSKIADKLSEKVENLSAWAKYLHQTAIDYGGRPNKDAIYSNAEFENGTFRTAEHRRQSALSSHPVVRSRLTSDHPERTAEMTWRSDLALTEKQSAAQ